MPAEAPHTKAFRDEVIRAVKEANAIDFDALGSAVAKLGPRLGTLGGDELFDDYFIKIFSSFLHIFKLDSPAPPPVTTE